MKKQGFTLIELLAVIVILAIIALIAVPIIFNIISDAKEKANERNIDLYAKAIENAVARTQLQQKVPNGIYTPSSDGKMLMKADTTFNVEYDGNTVVCDIIIIDEDFRVNLSSCKVSGKNINYTYGKIEETSQDCFEINNEGMITGYLCDDTVKEVIIPKTINGITVTSIGSFAFSNNQLTSVIIPNGVTNIMGSAFAYNQLTNIVIPDSVTFIGPFSFADNKLRHVEISKYATTIGTQAFSRNQLPDDQAYIYKRNSDGTIDTTTLIGYGGAKKDNVVIPDGVININSYAFYGDELTSVEIPNSVISIGQNAFADNQLTSVVIKNTKANVALGLDAFTCSATGFDNTKVTYQP